MAYSGEERRAIPSEEEGIIQMSEEQFRRIAKEVAKETAEQTLARIGFDVDDHKAVYEDSLYLRKQRLGSEQFQTWIKRGAVSTLLIGGLYALFEGLKSALRSKGM